MNVFIFQLYFLSGALCLPGTTEMQVLPEIGVTAGRRAHIKSLSLVQRLALSQASPHTGPWSRAYEKAPVLGLMDVITWQNSLILVF